MIGENYYSNWDGDVQWHFFQSVHISCGPSILISNPLFLRVGFDIIIHLYGVLYFPGERGRKTVQTPRRTPVRRGFWDKRSE